MAYKRDYFIENIEEIVGSAHEIHILDVSLNFPTLELGEYSDEINTNTSVCWVFEYRNGEWDVNLFYSNLVKLEEAYRRNEDYIKPIGPSSRPIQVLLLHLISNRKTLRDLFIRIDGKMVVD